MSDETLAVDCTLERDLDSDDGPVRCDLRMYLGEVSTDEWSADVNATATGELWVEFADTDARVRLPVGELATAARSVLDS